MNRPVSHAPREGSRQVTDLTGHRPTRTYSVRARPRRRYGSTAHPRVRRLWVLLEPAQGKQTALGHHLHVPLPLHLPEQQSSLEVQLPPALAQPTQTSPGSQLGEASGLLHCQFPLEQQVWPSKQNGLPPTPGSRPGSQQPPPGGPPFRHLPLRLQIPEQQSEFAPQGSFLAAHPLPPPSQASRPLRLAPLDAAPSASLESISAQPPNATAASTTKPIENRLNMILLLALWAVREPLTRDLPFVRSRAAILRIRTAQVKQKNRHSRHDSCESGRAPGAPGSPSCA